MMLGKNSSKNCSELQNSGLTQNYEKTPPSIQVDKVSLDMEIFHSLHIVFQEIVWTLESKYTEKICNFQKVWKA